MFQRVIEASFSSPNYTIKIKKICEKTSKHPLFSFLSNKCDITLPRLDSDSEKKILQMTTITTQSYQSVAPSHSKQNPICMGNSHRTTTHLTHSTQVDHMCVVDNHSSIISAHHPRINAIVSPLFFFFVKLTTLQAEFDYLLFICYQTSTILGPSVVQALFLSINTRM